jgi:hypothetical protein
LACWLLPLLHLLRLCCIALFDTKLGCHGVQLLVQHPQHAKCVVCIEPDGRVKGAQQHKEHSLQPV